MSIPLPFVCPVAGVAWRQDNVRQLQAGQPLEVRHDPDNPHDSNAYAVTTAGGDLLGFLPRALAARVRAEHDQLDAVVDEVLEGETWGVRIRVGATTPSPSEHTEARPSPQPTPAEPAAPTVLSRTGRRLGTLVEARHPHVIVRTSGGAEIPYPAELVTVQST